MARFKCPALFSLLVVEWTDATVVGRDAGWNTYEAWDDALANKPNGLSCSTVGWLIRRDPLRIVVAQSHNQFGHIADCISIPIGCVESVRVLETPPAILKKAM